jgi:hypothetical protein
MATNCARFIACQLPELSRIKTEEGRPFRAALARERIWLGRSSYVKRFPT